MNDKPETDGKNPGTDPVVNTDSNDKVDIVKEPDLKKDKEKNTEIDKKAKNREYHKEYMRNKRKKLKDYSYYIDRINRYKLDIIEIRNKIEEIKNACKELKDGDKDGI